MSLCRDSGDVEDQVDALIRIARLWVLRSEPEEATKAAKAALEAAQSGKKELAEAEALLGLAGVLKAKKDLAGAQTEAGKAEKLFKKCGHRTGELAALMLSWSAMVEEGPQQVAQVVQAAKKAAEAFKSAGDQQCAAEAFLEASAASREHGQVEEAASTAAAALQLFRQPRPQILQVGPKSASVVVVEGYLHHAGGCSANATCVCSTFSHSLALEAGAHERRSQGKLVITSKRGSSGIDKVKVQGRDGVAWSHEQ